MTQTLLAEDYESVPASLRESAYWEGVADVRAHPAGRRREAELSTEPAGATPIRSRLSLLCINFVNWLKGCAEAYAAAAAYENLSRLSDTELRHQSLSRDVLVRDLMQR